MTKVASDFLFDAEDDLRSAVDMAEACYALLEPGGSLSERRAAVVMRCLGHLQDHVGALLKAWEAATKAESLATITKPVPSDGHALKPAA